MFWTPAFAGVTWYLTFYETIKLYPFSKEREIGKERLSLAVSENVGYQTV
jgi:hypothetical protein